MPLNVSLTMYFPAGLKMGMPLRSCGKMMLVINCLRNLRSSVTTMGNGGECQENGDGLQRWGLVEKGHRFQRRGSGVREAGGVVASACLRSPRIQAPGRSHAAAMTREETKEQSVMIVCVIE